MHKDTEQTADDLRRPKGNSLLENYDLHDTGEREFVERIESLGFVVEAWGIDMRHEDGKDGLIYDDAMDFKVTTEDGELVAIADVKTKSNPRYMGRFNLRHFEHYREHAETFDVPAFVVMFQVDKKTDTIQDEFVFEVKGDEQVVSSKNDNLKTFPDGNHTCLVKHSYRHDWEHLVARVVFTSEE